MGMKVKNTLKKDLIWSTLRDKARNFAPDIFKLNPQSMHNINYIRHNYPCWQYNGVVEFEEVMVWCEEHFGNDWVWNSETIYFKREEDKTAFLLRWT